MPRVRPLTEAGRAKQEDDKRNIKIKEDIAAGLVSSGMTIHTLAAKTGMSLSSLYRKRKNPAELTIGECREIYRALGKEIAI